jgi:hypothetical protein
MAQKTQGTGPATQADREREGQHQQESRENEQNRATRDRQQQPNADEGHLTSPGGQQSR